MVLLRSPGAEIVFFCPINVSWLEMLMMPIMPRKLQEEAGILAWRSSHRFSCEHSWQKWAHGSSFFADGLWLVFDWRHNLI